MTSTDLIIWTKKEIEKEVPYGKVAKIKFMLNRFTFKLEYHALSMIVKNKIDHIFFPEMPPYKLLTITE